MIEGPCLFRGPVYRPPNHTHRWNISRERRKYSVPFLLLFLLLDRVVNDTIKYCKLLSCVDFPVWFVGPLQSPPSIRHWVFLFSTPPTATSSVYTYRRVESHPRWGLARRGNPIQFIPIWD